MTYVRTIIIDTPRTPPPSKDRILRSLGVLRSRRGSTGISCVEASAGEMNIPLACCGRFETTEGGVVVSVSSLLNEAGESICAAVKLSIMGVELAPVEDCELEAVATFPCRDIQDIVDGL